METIKIGGKRFNIKPKNRFHPFEPTIYVAEAASENTQSSRAGALLSLAAAAYLALTPAAEAQEAPQPQQQQAAEEPGKEAAKEVVFDGFYSRLTPSYALVAGSMGKNRGSDFWNSGIRARAVGYPISDVFGELNTAGTVGEFSLDEQGEHRQVTGGVFGKVGWDFLRSKPAEKGVFNDQVFIPFVVGGYEKASRNDGAFVREETLSQIGLGALYMNGPFQITGDYRHMSGGIGAKFDLDGKLKGDVAKLGASFDIESTGTVLIAQARIHRMEGELEGAVNGMPVKLTSTSRGYGGLFGVVQDTQKWVKGTYVGLAVMGTDTRLDNESSIAAILNDRQITRNVSAIVGARPSEWARFLPDDLIAGATFGLGHDNDKSNEFTLLVGYRFGGK